MKKETFVMGKMLLLVCFNSLPVFSQEIDDESKYIYVEADVIDTVKYEAMKVEKEQKFTQRKKEKIEKLKVQKAMTIQLINLANEDGKILDESLYDYALDVFSSFAGNSSSVDRKVIKMINRKKVSKMSVPYLSSLLNKQISEINSISTETENLTIAPQDIPYKKVFKKVINPNSRAYWYVNDKGHLDGIDKKMQMNGWEWLQIGLSEKVRTMAPYSMTYEKYASHPQYRVIDDKVYDNDGNLVYQICLLRSNTKVINYIIEELKKEVYIADFKANKYDILKSPAATQEEFKEMLGLPHKNTVDPKTVKKNRKMINDYVNAVGGSSYRQRERAKSEAVGLFVLGAMLDPNYNTARKFKQQLEEDHKNDFVGIWRISRVSNTSFKIVFLNDYCESSYTGLATIQQTKPYNWQWSVKLIPNEESIDINKDEYLNNEK